MKDKIYGVYFIYCGEKQTSLVKIGVTCDIEERVSALQTSNPFQLFCKAYIPCHDKEQAYKLESFLHNRFKKSRMIGEWFRLYHLNLKGILEGFSKRQATPLKKQGFNLVKKATKHSRKLQKENNELKNKVIDLEDQVEELTQTILVTGANLFQ